jgi:hypothetical protein
MDPDNAPQDNGADAPSPAAEGGAALSRTERRIRAVQDALRTLIRDHYTYRFGAGSIPADEIPVSLSLTVRPHNDWELEIDPPFVEQVDAQLEDAQAGRARYVEGRVYCFRCASSDCEHSVAPGPLSVFRGYGSTGVPEWSELVQALIDMRDERVDQLYSERPMVLAGLQLGRDLRRQQLTSFGRASKTYSILGQVVAGYFAWRAGGRGRPPALERLAATFQVVETRAHDGSLRLVLNPIVGGIERDRWDELVVDTLAASVGKALEDARWALAEVERRARVARDERKSDELRKAMGSVPRILLRLARALEQGARQTQRRTRHAQAHQRTERPVHKAVDDARHAAADALFFDEKRQTWIACGRQGRAHAFNAEGRHVTSFVLPAGGAEFRIRTGRWRALQADEVERFRAAIERAGRAEP